MRSSVFFTVFTFAILCVVKSAPIPLVLGTVYGQDDLRDDIIMHPGVEHDPHMPAIQDAIHGAHAQIMNMKNMLDNNHPDLHQHLVNAFGANYNRVEITKIVDKMATGTLHVGGTNVPNVGQHANAVATTNSIPSSPDTRTLFTEQFHQMTPAAQIGTVVHEASHAFGVTKDYFAPDGSKALSSAHVKDGTTGTQPKSGYLHQDFQELKQIASPIMHKNADSYKVFAHTATHGLHTPLPPRFQAQPAHPASGSNSNANSNCHTDPKKPSTCHLL